MRSDINRLPAWFRQKLPDYKKTQDVRTSVNTLGIHTVCESAHCPNQGTCWEQKTATFMILGCICTRRCRFCAVGTGHPLPPDPIEPQRIATAVKQLGLRYAVITSVTRDDLRDGGAGQFSQTIHAIQSVDKQTQVKVEVLIPDMSNKMKNLKIITDAKPQVIGHNMETVRRLSPEVRPQADYERSLGVLRNLKKLDPAILIKSGLMLGLGETYEEVVEAMRDLLGAGCDLLTIGQYLAPTRLDRHLRVQRFVSPEEFDSYKELGLALGFKSVQSAPLVRSSFLAEEGYKQCVEAL